MATYKAEFLSHYYQGKLRPAAAYSMGLIFWWAQIASHFPNLINLLSRTPVISSIAKSLGGIAPERQLPPFAEQTFRDWFLHRQTRVSGKSRVLLWVDTFSNYFKPETAKAAVRVLEAAGFNVAIPQRLLCCGRPLYDFGFLPLAKSLLKDILGALRQEIRAGTPIVGLEPSCLTVFRDELTNLFPNDEDALRLRQQTFLFSEFLQKKAPEVGLPILHRKALVQAHCHHAAVIKLSDEQAVLKRLGIDYQFLQTGCCGMAASFGYEKDKYDVSVRCGERGLLPAVRNASKETLIIADGFSCREQIEQLTDRGALHLAEVIDLAMKIGPDGPAGDYPEKATRTAVSETKPKKYLLLGLFALVCGVVIGWMVVNRKRKPTADERRFWLGVQMPPKVTQNVTEPTNCFCPQSYIQAEKRNLRTSALIRGWTYAFAVKVYDGERVPNRLLPSVEALRCLSWTYQSAEHQENRPDPIDIEFETTTSRYTRGRTQQAQSALSALLH
jgi:Fe-S oxidoreductase